MTLEEKKKELEIKRVSLGVDELELRVLEREEDIKRLKQNIEISKAKLAELKGE